MLKSLYREACRENRARGFARGTESLPKLVQATPHLTWEPCEAARRCLQADDGTGNYGRPRDLAVLGETHGRETNGLGPIAGLRTTGVAFAVVAAQLLAHGLLRLK